MTVVDPATGELVYANAGHNPPLLVRAAGGFETLGGGGMILGIMPKAAYTESKAVMQSGDVLVLFSDGVTEAPDPRAEEFGEARLAALVASLIDRPAAEIVESIHAAVAEYTEGAPPPTTSPSSPSGDSRNILERSCAGLAVAHLDVLIRRTGSAISAA